MRAQPDTQTPVKPDSAVSDTRLGLETIELLRKGINPAGAQTNSLTPEQLLVAPEPLNATSVIEPPENKDRDESTLRDLRRQQWRSENWLVEGMRRSELAENEADLAEDNLRSQNGSASPAEDTSARARVESGSSNEWLALAVETQRETESEARGDDVSAPDQVVGSNPLGDFMAGWLSGDSRVMLASTTEGSPGTSRSPATRAADDRRFDELSLAHIREPESRIKGALPATEVMGGGSGLNPFLAFTDAEVGSDPRAMQAALDLPAPDAPIQDRAFQLSTIIPTEATPAPGNPTIAPAERLDEKPSEPWRPPPRDDEKYFPRLKRF